MKRIILPLCILCIILMLLCCSCGLFGDQRYNCEVDKVESVQIVRLDKYVQEESRYEYPRQMDVQYAVIRIDYRNGDFDLIYSDAQSFNRSGENQYGYFFFDDEQFNALISDYITE